MVGGTMLERLVSFTVFGLFVFAPAVANWWQLPLSDWYLQYFIWLVLIALCFWIQLLARDKSGQG